MTKKFVVVGLGELGSTLATALADAGAEVVALDVEMRHVEAIKDRVAYAVQGDAQDAAVLRAVEAQNADVAVVTIGDDFEAAVMTVSALRDLGVQEIVARASNDRERRVLERLGAGRVVSLEVEMGRRLAQTLLAPHVREVHEVARGYDVVEWPVPRSLAGRTLAEIDLRRRIGVLAIAIRGADRDRAETPDADRALKEGDVLFIAGDRDRVAKLASL